MPQRHHFAIERLERVDRFLDLEDLLGPDRRVRGRCQTPQQHRGQRRRAGLGQADRDRARPPGATSRIRVPRCWRWNSASRSLTTSRSQRNTGSLGSLEIAVDPLLQVEEAVLKHVGGVDSTLEPRVQAQLDHPAQAVAVPLEQLGERAAIAGSKPLNQVDSARSVDLS